MQISIAPSGQPATHYAKGFKVSSIDRLTNLAITITRNAWCPAVYNDGVRLKETFLHSDVCALDFDSPETPLAQAFNIFDDIACVIGTTKSHQKEKCGVVCDRYRVVVPWDKRMDDCAVYEGNMHRIVNHYDADSACIDGARFFWPCTEIVKINFEGYTMESAEVKRPQVNVDTYARAGKEMRIPGFLEAMIRKPIPAGERNRTVWEMAFKLALCNVPVAKIEALILSNPTCKNTAADFTEREITETITKGIRTACEKKGPEHFQNQS